MWETLEFPAAEVAAEATTPTVALPTTLADFHNAALTAVEIARVAASGSLVPGGDEFAADAASDDPEVVEGAAACHAAAPNPDQKLVVADTHPG